MEFDIVQVLQELWEQSSTAQGDTLTGMMAKLNLGADFFYFYTCSLWTFWKQCNILRDYIQSRAPKLWHVDVQIDFLGHNNLNDSIQQVGNLICLP